jgi:hypothetical protein
MTQLFALFGAAIVDIIRLSKSGLQGFLTLLI